MQNFPCGNFCVGYKVFTGFVVLDLFHKFIGVNLY